MTRKYASVLLALIVALPILACPSWAADAQPAPTRAMHAFPTVGGYEVLCGDFHMHTVHSDGKLTPRERVLEAWRYGYDVIAITDHGNFKAYKEALPLAEALGLVLIRGLETGVAKKEHMVALGVSADYKPRNPHAWAENKGEDHVFYQDQLREIEKAGGLVVQAHPHVGFREPLKWGIEQGIIVGVEVKNEVVGSRWNTEETHGTWCYPWGFDWALEYDLAVFANSDVHGKRGDKSPPITLVLAKERTDESVLEAIRERRTVAWFNGMLWGRRALLAKLIRTVVKLQRTADEDGGTWLRIQNQSPVPLEAALQARHTPDGTIEIGAYEEVIIKCDDLQSTFAIIRWENLWISVEQNLLTAHYCPLGRQQ